MKKARANSKKPGSTSALPGNVCPPPLADADISCQSPHSAPHSEQRPPAQLPSQYAPPMRICPPKAGRERANSKTNTHTNRLIILSSIQNELITRLERQAEIAYTLRRLEEVEAVSRQLEEIHAPIASYWQGLAAQGIAARRHGTGQFDHARKLLEHAVNYAPRNYQARALLILGSVAEYKGEYQAGREFYIQAARIQTSDLYAVVEGNRAFAIQASIDDDHNQAITLLERALPVAHYYRARSPYIYMQTLNSLAVEYQEVGRLREALELARINAASPLASIYSELRETQSEVEQEIARRERATCIVVVPARQRERRPQRRVIFSFQIVGLHVRRKVIKPTIGRAPVIRSIVEQVATVAPIHGPPFNL